MLTLFGLAVCGYLILVAALYLMQRQLLYLPDRSIPSRTVSGVPEMSEVRLQTDDGLDLLAWHQSAAQGRSTILYLHGNGGHIATGATGCARSSTPASGFFWSSTAAMAAIPPGPPNRD